MWRSWSGLICLGGLVGALTVPMSGGTPPAQQPAVASPATSGAAPTATANAEKSFVDRYCVRCHNERSSSGDLVLAGLDPRDAGTSAETWERVVRKLRSR